MMMDRIKVARRFIDGYFRPAEVPLLTLEERFLSAEEESPAFRVYWEVFALAVFVSTMAVELPNRRQYERLR